MIPYKYFKEVEQEKNDLANRLSLLTSQMKTLKKEAIRSQKPKDTKDQSCQVTLNISPSPLFT